MFVVGELELAPLRGPHLPHRATRPAAGDAEFIGHMLDKPTAALKAQEFPDAASFRTALSSSASARRRLSGAAYFSR
ncbi:MAG: hypothetical protein AAFO88_00855, partial [Pseudomonadota bacterium]